MKIRRMKMKRLIIPIILALLLVVTSMPAFGEEDPRPIYILHNQKVCAGGTSTFVIDLKEKNKQHVEYQSLQFLSNTTPYWTALSGATVNAAARITHVLPSNIASGFRGLLSGVSPVNDNFRSTSIVSGLAHDSGNSRYVYDWSVKNTRYELIDITAGVTDMYVTVVVNLD